ncbi:MAG: HAD-IIA family hydrolase [Clostridiales Family XIII bacterium]|jgi:HAD superfamily hydrolase (TIGR01450 family)|nr:HAD-IIA family hydrolase [Clostridiales Family XIII bacterium]
MFVKSELLKDVKLFVLDLDGTFYLGERLLPGSLPFVDRARATGRRFVFFTNNTSRAPEAYVERLSRMGLAVTRGDILTSGDVTVQYLKNHHPGANVYLLGTEALRREFAAQGIALTNAEAEAGAEAEAADGAKADVVVAAFDTELTYTKLERACTLIRGGAAFLATHPDINCPTEDGFIPDCGALCAAIALSTGKNPRFLGKPYPETLAYVLAKTGCTKEEVAFVGDRLYTDVAAGVNGGAKGFLVLSGETKESDIAGQATKPTAVFKDLGEIAMLLAF